MLAKLRKISLTQWQGYLLVALVFLLPYERIPSLDLALLGTSITVRLSQVVALLLLICCLPLARKRISDFKHMPYIGLGLFLFFYLLSTGLAVNLKRALVVFAFTAFVVATSIVVSWLIENKRLDTLKAALYWTTVIVLVFGFYQYIGDAIGLSPVWTGLRENYVKEIFGFPRIQSTGLEPLYYANFLLIPLFVFGSDFILGKKEHPWLLAALITQIVLTVSRGAYAGAIAGLIVLIVLGILNKAKAMAIGGLMSLAVLGVALGLLMTSIDFSKSKNTKESSVQKTETIVAQATNFDTQDDRDRNRDLAIAAFKAQPLFGLGPGGFDKYARDNVEIYRPLQGNVIVNNETLEILAEGGLLATLALGIALLWIVVNAIISIWNKQFTKESWPWLVGLTCYLIALAVQYQTFSTLYIIHIWVAIGILIGVVNNIDKEKQSTNTIVHNKRVKV